MNFEEQDKKEQAALEYTKQPALLFGQNRLPNLHSPFTISSSDSPCGARYRKVFKPVLRLDQTAPQDIP